MKIKYIEKFCHDQINDCEKIIDKIGELEDVEYEITYCDTEISDFETEYFVENKNEKIKEINKKKEDLKQKYSELELTIKGMFENL